MKLKKISKYILILFMILQPIFDIYYLYTDSIINIFKFSPATIIRMIFLLFLGISSFCCIKKKNKKYLYLFLGIYSIYSILHLYNATLFNVNFKSYQNYSHLREIFYLIRMLCPILLIFITYQNKVSRKDMKKVFINVYLIFSLVMIITNILGIALTSYGNGVIKANFLSWFNLENYKIYGYEHLASKGLFHMANQVTGVMTAFFPIIMYIFLTEKFKIKNFLTIFLSMFAMLMIGTRIASFGMMAVLIFSCVMYLIISILKHEKYLNKIGVTLTLTLVILFVSIFKYLPVANRTYITDDTNMVYENIKNSNGDMYLTELVSDIVDDEYEDSLEKQINYIEKYYKIYGFDEIYIIDLYNYQIDPEFWIDMFKVPFEDRANHRQLKTFITRRIIELNNNKLDSLFGLSFTRLRNALIYMENDIIGHFYSIGLIGIILLIMPYLLIVLYAIFKMFKDKNHFNYLNMTYIVCILLVYLIGYFSGNIFDEWIVTLFLGFTTGLLLLNIKNNNKI